MQITDVKNPIILTSPPPRGVKLLNWRQVCERIGGCSKAEFFRKVHRGEFEEAYRVHNHKGIRIPDWAVVRYMEQRRLGDEQDLSCDQDALRNS